MTVKRLRHMLGDLTFMEAFHHTGALLLLERLPLALGASANGSCWVLGALHFWVLLKL